MTEKPPPAGAISSAARRTAMVFDLDGVLADARHRLVFVSTRPKDWEAFFAAAPDDPVLADGLAEVERALAAGHEVVYLTGRPERCRSDTLSWLSRNGLPAGPLHMRRDTDRRPARITKLQTLRALSRDREVVALVDDDAAVVEVVRAAGFAVIHATWMEPSTSGVDLAPEPAGAVLFEAQETDGRT